MNGRGAVVGCLLALGLSVAGAVASSSGISGYSGDPASGGLDCNVCHSGGVVPAVTLTGPTVVPVGSLNVYTLRISGGQSTAGGLDVSASDGMLSVREPGTKLLSGEITHTLPRLTDGAGEVSWTFHWTAPMSGGTSTLYGSGNSVDLTAGNNGDASASVLLNVSVTSGATPGETSAETLAPLLVTGYDPFSGNLSLSYETGCETTSNNIYYGPLDQVSFYGWSGEDCDIGTSGSYGSFDPGAGSYFFVVVGHNGTDEGSYGRDRRGGSRSERPPHAAGTCGQSQTLSTPCTP